MRLREITLILPALAAFGCSRAPEAVFVDLERVVRQEQQPVAMSLPALPSIQPTIILPRIASLPRTAGIVILDQAGGKIDEARRLIEADRRQAIQTLTQRLRLVQTDRFDAERVKALDELEKAQVAQLQALYARLMTIFEAYAKERGPKTLRADLLQVRNPELYPSRNTPADFAKLTGKKPISGTPVEVSPSDIPPSFTEQQRADLIELASMIKALDDQYEADANRLLDSAIAQITANERAILEEIDRQYRASLTQADRTARETIEGRRAPTNLNLSQNRSVVVSAVEGRSIGVAGSTLAAGAITGLILDPIVDAQHIRRSVEQQLEIWLKTRGLVRSRTKSSGRDATDEFIEWRTSHRLGQ
jgi:hypothetical protein